ncbi:MAG: 23S rRNA (cytidine(2498)-2'-O)-methyltransferase RlmM, partial [Deltaproteobacteria bacterium]
KVIAIDPGSMAPELLARKGLTHIRGSAFDYEPDEPVDWLLCDMVWRTLEVAALLARWGRNRHARLMIANIKLPMRGKVDFLQRVRQVLADGGWQGVRMRQLYHDREEITLTGHTTR